MKRKLALIPGLLCILFALIPVVFYGIFHLGVLLLFGLGAALTLLVCGRGFFSGRLRRVLAICLTVAGAYALVVSVFMTAQALRRSNESGAPVAVVVLGAKVNGTAPSLMLRHRLNAALRYLEEYPEAVCVVSGGQGADEIVPEAAVMADYLLQRGVTPDRILIEQSSTNTRENLQFSAALLDEHFGGEAYTVAIATDSFHQLRAAIFGRERGLDCRAVSSVSPWGLFPSYWAREWAAIPVALLQTALS